MVRITPNQALQRFREGKPLILVPSKCCPTSVCAIRYDSENIANLKESEVITTFHHAKNGDVVNEVFSRLVASFKFYNCTSETGQLVHFYASLTDNV